MSILPGSTGGQSWLRQGSVRSLFFG